jgi:hypothetical protein
VKNPFITFVLTWWLLLFFCVLFEQAYFERLDLCTGGETLMVVQFRSSPSSKNIEIK